MRDGARDSLSKALKAHPDHALLSRVSCLGLLKDFGGGQHPEITVLADCVEHKAALRLSKLARKKVEADEIAKIVDEFSSKTFYDPDVCRWAVESWAIGFNIKYPRLAEPRSATGTGGSPKKQSPPVEVPTKSAEVSFDLEQRDLDALKLYIQIRSNEKERHRRYLHLIAAAIGVLMALVGASQWWTRCIAAVAIWGFLFCAVTGILWLCEWLAAIYDKRNAQPGVLSRHTIKISNEGLFEKTPHDSQSCSWMVVQWFHVDPKHLFIAVPSGVHVIPLRAFESDLKKGLQFVELTKTFFGALRKTNQIGADNETSRTRDESRKPQPAGKGQAKKKK